MKTKPETTCEGSGAVVTGCKWIKCRCRECGGEFFPVYDTGRWKMPKHDREDGER